MMNLWSRPCKEQEDDYFYGHGNEDPGDDDDD